MPAAMMRINFPGANGHELAARLDLPVGAPRAYALFAHCFTCSKDLAAARRIAQGLAQEGIGVLRFDFTGLGHSEGEFANTNFSSNVGDLLAATNYMRRELKAPAILIGHSLGGAAVLAAAREIAEVKAVATIGAPSDVGHVLHQFGASLDDVRQQGETEVTLAGRPFTIQRQFVEDDLVVSRLRHHRTPEIGIMLELPSVVEIIDALVKEVDFLSIGTNDFVQYMLAVDRTNSRVANYYQPWHPSVLRGLSKMTAAAVRTGTDISVCGETARDLDYIPFLVGIGVRSLSVSPRFLPLVQQWISEIDVEESKKFAADLLEQTSIKGILEIVASA